MLILKECISLCYWIGIIILASKIFRNNVEYNRKFVHIMISNWWFIAIAFFDNFLQASVVPIIFIIINGYATFGKSEKFVAGMKRGKSDLSLGLICYPLGYLVALYLAFNCCNNIAYAGVGIMALGYGDGFAAIIGKKFNYKPYYIWGNKKTISGTVGMFLCTFLSVTLYCLIYNIEPTLVIAAVSALVGCLVEAVAIRGTDNIMIPLVVSLVSIAILQGGFL